MLRHLGLLLLTGALVACADTPEAPPPPPEVGGMPPFFAVRAAGATTPAMAQTEAAGICGQVRQAVALERTDACLSFFRGETIPNCWVLTFRCVDAG